MSTSEDERVVSVSRKRRGTARASITRLLGRVGELEGKPSLSATEHLAAQQLLQKLESLDGDFKTHHQAMVDRMEGDALDAEQTAIDEHDDRVADLTVRLRQLMSKSSASHDPSSRHLAKRVEHLGEEFRRVLTKVDSVGSGPRSDPCLLLQCEEQVAGLKAELVSVSREILSLDVEDPGLTGQQTKLSQGLFDLGLKIKRLRTEKTSSSSMETVGVKLPKLEVPMFDGSVTHWKSFWEQFVIAVHDRTTLSKAEKLTYLRHALKEGSAKHVIEGLSGSSDQYDEAVDCLRKRFDRPRLLHQAHVRAIVDVPPIKEGNGRELRKLHDTVNQHLRALKAMGQEPSGAFITSLIELKMDPGTTFEWHKFSQDSTEVPHYTTLLDFLNLRAQAAESTSASKKRDPVPFKRVSAHTLTSLTTTLNERCLACKTVKHPLYACPTFKGLSHEQKLALLKSNDVCLNCLKPGHFVKRCVSTHRCHTCQRAHHTLLHHETKTEGQPPSNGPPAAPPASPVVSNVAQSSLCTRQPLLMTCRVLIMTANGVTSQARALLDSASSTSFISERLAQHLRLSRSRRTAQVLGIGGISHKSTSHAVVSFTVTPLWPSERKFEVEAVVLPKVTSNLPLHPITLDSSCHHLSGLRLADPDFGSPGNVDVLLGVDVFSNSLLHGRRCGSPGSPNALETCFGWVLCGAVDSPIQPASQFVSNHASVLSTDDLLRKFWEVEKVDSDSPAMSLEEKQVVGHFQERHVRDGDGRFMVPLPFKPDARPLGESRSLAVRRFLSLERSLRSRNQFQDLCEVIEEYFDQGHAEIVPTADLNKPPEQVFYLPVHAVVKRSSTTTKVRAVFDASAKTSTGVSLNDQLMVGPTVHSPLVDVLLRFRFRRIALTTDVSRMYRAVLLPAGERDLHRFVWRQDPNAPIKDYRMTRVTFGVASSSFAANMALKQNAIDHAEEYPLAVTAVHESFYVDDGLVGADSPEEARKLQQQLQELFARGGFLLRKWKTSDPAVLQHLSTTLLDIQPSHVIPDPDGFTKTLGLEWSPALDCFRLTVAEFPRLETITKRALVSDVAKTFDVLGWFAPSIVKIKVLLQRLWEAGIGWDDEVPSLIEESWKRWRVELPILTQKFIERCYFPKDMHVSMLQLHGFSDASEDAYSAVVYLRMIDSASRVHVSLTMAKTKVAPLKRLTIPRLELCGANLLAKLLHHVKEVLHIASSNVFAWTDSTVVLGWLIGSPRQLKTFVGNRVSNVIDLVPPDRWRHVAGVENPADCASRGLFPSELLDYRLWWEGPHWLSEHESTWPLQPELQRVRIPAEERLTSLHVSLTPRPVLPIQECFSSFMRLKRVTAWVLRFVRNCRSCNGRDLGHLSVDELLRAERYWVAAAQDSYAKEVKSLTEKQCLNPKSHLLHLRPIIDMYGLLRVGGRESHATLPYAVRHPLILPGSHTITKLIIQSEHLRLLHAGPTLVGASLSRRFHIVGARKIIRSITRSCVPCRRNSMKPRPQMLGQLPSDRLIPGAVFERVGVDYAGPLTIKSGSRRKPQLLKAYVCIFVSFSVKAVHIELVSDLTADAFIATLRRFTARRGKPSVVWSNHGSNFVGSARILKELFEFLGDSIVQGTISEFCSTQGIRWKFIPQHGPHFGGLWEAAVKSAKNHLRKTVGSVHLTFEELTTVLSQIEACLNSRPIAPLPDKDDGLEALTPGHFLVGKPLEALPDSSLSYQPNSVLRRWYLCQSLVHSFWRRWSREYLSHIRQLTKWRMPSRNYCVGDIVCLQEEGLHPTKWPLARVAAVHPGKDGLVRVLTVKTAKGSYTRPVTKAALLLPYDS